MFTKSLWPKLTLALGGVLVGVMFYGAAQDPSGDADAARLRATQVLLDQTTPPVGAVIPFWGAKADILKLDCYEICDGAPVYTKGSPLHGKKKPDLGDRFIMGFNGDKDLRTAPETGGTNTIDARPLINSDRQEGTEPHVLTTEELPLHSHPHSHYLMNPTVNGSASFDEHERINRAKPTETLRAAASDGNHSYSLKGGGPRANTGLSSSDSTSAGESKSHFHKLPKIPSHDNRPAYVGLYYIIRVK